MEDFLKKEMTKDFDKSTLEWANMFYDEDINNDANSRDWLENNTSYIYKVGVLAAIDAFAALEKYATYCQKLGYKSPVFYAENTNLNQCLVYCRGSYNRSLINKAKELNNLEK